MSHQLKEHEGAKMFVHNTSHGPSQFVHAVDTEEQQTPKHGSSNYTAFIVIEKQGRIYQKAM